MRKIVLFFSGLIVSTICSADVSLGRKYTSDYVLAAFDKESPGRGVDSYDYKVLDHAMGYALYAAAQVVNEDHVRAGHALNWLMLNSNGGKGWGLPFSWDAFSDGSVNPSSTIYGITVAWGVKALLDYMERTGSVKYVGVVESILNYYSNSFSLTNEGGYFWYSDRSSDNKNVHNVSAMLAGQYARAGKLLNRSDYTELAVLAFNEVWAARENVGSSMRWSYSDFSSRPNDSIHAAYVVYGLSEYAKASGFKLGLDEAYEYLNGFYSEGIVFEYSRFESLSPVLMARPARSWGVGMLVFVFSDTNRLKDADALIGALTKYEYKPGYFGLTVGDENFFPRVQGHVALGIARRQRSLLGF